MLTGQLNLERELLDAVEFCFAKADALKGADMLSIPLNQRMAHFSHIEDRAKSVYVEVGIDARQRIHRWCLRFLQRRGLSHVANVSEAGKWLEQAIAHTFFAQRVALAPPAISRLIQRFERYLAERMRTFRYFWPCQICHDEQDHEVVIGPVRLRPMAHAKTEVERGLGAWGEDARGVVGDRIRAYFEGFTWMAEVAVEAADQKAAKALSLQCVQVALTVIRLFYGGATARRLRVAEEQSHLLERAELYLEDGVPHLVWSQSSGQEPFPEGWWQDLNRGENAQRLRLLDTIVAAIPFPERQTLLKRKLLNALIWFNDGATDAQWGAQIAKFVNCLECLASCGERRDLATRVGERIATLVSAWPEEETFDLVVAKVKRVYAVRSELVHGSRDPLDLELGYVVQSAAHLAHMAILAFVDFLLFVGADRTDYTNKMLSADFAIIRGNVLRTETDSRRGAGERTESPPVR